MRIEEYEQQVAGGTIMRPDVDMLKHCILGMNEEAGECAGIVKKSEYAGGALNLERLDEEAGDLLWYVTRFCIERGYTLADLALLNLRKLAKRHPTKYTLPEGA
jgi:MazG nucleotide pyrophosphohydrolase domain.